MQINLSDHNQKYKRNEIWNKHNADLKLGNRNSISPYTTGTYTSKKH